MSIHAYAIHKMNEHGLIQKGWTFGWNKKRRSIGLCKVRARRIELSLFYLPHLSEYEQMDTVLHEIAHALDVEMRGYSKHDIVWETIARRVGAKPEACKALNPVEEAGVKKASKYVFRCANGHSEASHRKSRHQFICALCKKEGKVVPLEQFQNY